MRSTRHLMSRRCAKRWPRSAARYLPRPSAARLRSTVLFDPKSRVGRPFSPRPERTIDVMDAGDPNSGCRGRGLAIDLIGALLERRREPRKRGVEHRAHQHAQHAAPEFIGDEEADVAGVVASRLEGP